MFRLYRLAMNINVKIMLVVMFINVRVDVCECIFHSVRINFDVNVNSC